MRGEEKRIRYKILIPILVMLALAVFSSIYMTAKADEAAAIMEVYTNETDLSVYVKNAGNALSDITVQIGTSQSSQVTCQSITDTEFETLILIDNSLSIPKEDRNRIAEFLECFFQAKGKNEKIAIGVFSRDITYLTSFTSDYDALRGAADAVSYQNQDTYITDMLYELWVTEYLTNPRDVYRRILIIADGIDDESVGYTSAELNELIKENTYPIYTIGCKTEKNSTELENLFALSRLSNAAYFLLDSMEDVSSIAEVLGADKEIVKVVATPPAELMDGSKKMVKINFSSQSVSTEMRMPQQVGEQETEIEEFSEEPTEELVMEESTVEEETEVEDPEAIRKAAAKKFIMLVVGAWIFIIVVIIIFILIRRNRKKQYQEMNEVENLKAQREKELAAALANRPEAGQQERPCIVLTDVKEPTRNFTVPLKHSIIIGRSAADCHIVLDYDKSVSSRHCEIFEKENQVLVRDLGSTNGTFVDGRRIEEDTRLVSNSSIVLGNLEMRFEYYK